MPKGVSRYLERGRETGYLLKKRAFTTVTTHKNFDCIKARPSKSSLVDASFKMTEAETFTMMSRVVVVRDLGELLCAVGPMYSLISLFIVTSLAELSSERQGSNFSFER